jgi:uncharacterized coiled-coil DUF342 family protein
MKTAEQILNDNASFVLFYSKANFECILAAMEEYAIQKLESTVASYEIDRVNLVAMTLERDELDEQYKNAVADRDAYRDMYKETVQERDGWMAEYQSLLRIATCLYKADKDAIKEMINEGLGGDSYEKFKNHLGV